MKAVIFDMDGLLLDTERLYQEQWHKAAKDRNIDLGETFAREICGSTGELLYEIVHKYYPGYDPREIAEEVHDAYLAKREEGIEKKEGVDELLEYLSKTGYRIAVASSSKINEIKDNLENVGILNYFEVIASGEEVESGKPSPDIFLLAAERLQEDPTECYVFEDSFNGIIAAKAAGCKAIMIPDLVEPTNDIKEICYVYSSLLEAMKAMEGEEL